MSFTTKESVLTLTFVKWQLTDFLETQFGNSYIDLEVMKKYIQSFPKGDNNKQREIFWGFVIKYKDYVQEKFHSFFPENVVNQIYNF